MSIAVPLYGFGASGGGTGGTLTVTAPANVTITVSKDGKTKTKNSGTSGVVVFKGLSSGMWTVTITGDGKTAQKNVVITTDYSTAISFSTIPEFTYTGDYEIVNDSDEPITVSQGNWKIRFLTSGTLTFTNLNGAENGIDVFLVGGGGAGGQWCNGGSDGSGGNGGYTKTSKGVTVTAGTAYNIVVGAGAASQTVENANGKPGGKTSAFGVTVDGGDGGTAWQSEEGRINKGGSGGGSGNSDGNTGGNGGSDGANGGSAYWSGGTGQGTTTREFGETGKRLYSGGGGGSWNGKGGAGGGADAGKSASANTGGGGGGGYNSSEASVTNGGKGGSGIVIIRNARGAA